MADYDLPEFMGNDVPRRARHGDWIEAVKRVRI